MSLVRVGPPRELMLQLRDRYGLKDFVETGTYHGSTAVWAASHFDNVITIENSGEIYEDTVARHGKIKNIDFIFGDSRSVLKTIVPKLTRPAIFWLDSHWSGGRTSGRNDECPLIEEIHVINTSASIHFLLIDDARLFTSPPPRPHSVEQWPSVDAVIEALKSGTPIYIVLIEDAIVAVPTYAKRLVVDYCQEINTKAWEERGKSLDASAFRQGCRLIGEGLRLMCQGSRVQLRP